MATTSNSTSKNAKSYISLNDCTLTGRISKVSTNEARSYVRFSVAHNMGKKNDTLFVEFTMFNRNGKKDVEIPFDLIQVGKAVKVSGFLKPNNMRDAEGNITRYDNQLVVKTIEAISSEAADAEDAPEEEAAPAEQAAPAEEAAPAEAPQEEPKAKKARKSSKKSDK